MSDFVLELDHVSIAAPGADGPLMLVEDCTLQVTAGESLGLGLEPRDHGHRHPTFHEIPVQTENLARFLFGFIVRGVRRVPLLPEELQRAEE